MCQVQSVTVLVVKIGIREPVFASSQISREIWNPWQISTKKTNIPCEFNVIQ